MGEFKEKTKPPAAAARHPASSYGLVAGVVGQVGCLVLFVIGGAFLLGLGLDEILGTRPTFIFVMLLLSVPLNLAALVFYTRNKAKQLDRAARQKEEESSE